MNVREDRGECGLYSGHQPTVNNDIGNRLARIQPRLIHKLPSSLTPAVSATHSSFSQTIQSPHQM